VAGEAFRSGRSPEDFVREIFADDIASREHDEASFIESLSEAGDE